MSYTPTAWATGDVITADKLNNIEDGILDAPGVAVFEFEVITDNDNQVVTEAQISDVMAAFNNGKECIARICSHASGQPIEYSTTYDCAFELGGSYGVSCSHYIIQEGNQGQIQIQVHKLSGFGDWTYNYNSFIVNIAT